MNIWNISRQKWGVDMFFFEHRISGIVQTETGLLSILNLISGRQLGRLRSIQSIQKTSLVKWQPFTYFIIDAWLKSKKHQFQWVVNDCSVKSCYSFRPSGLSGGSNLGRLQLPNSRISETHCCHNQNMGMSRNAEMEWCTSFNSQKKIMNWSSVHFSHLTLVVFPSLFKSFRQTWCFVQAAAKNHSDVAARRSRQKRRENCCTSAASRQLTGPRSTSAKTQHASYILCIYIYMHIYIYVIYIVLYLYCIYIYNYIVIYISLPCGYMFKWFLQMSLDLALVFTKRGTLSNPADQIHIAGMAESSAEKRRDWPMMNFFRPQRQRFLVSTCFNLHIMDTLW